ENQLSPGSFGISPLSTAHPSLLQQTPVRSSTRHYSRFNLAMDSSPGFGSTPSDSMPSSDSLSLRLRLSALTLPLKVTRWLILQEARHHPTSYLVSGSDCL